MEKETKFTDTVILIDALFMDFVIDDLKKNFERMLNRELHDVELDKLITYISLDADVREGSDEIQVLFIYGENVKQLRHCHPSDLEKELNNTAFRNPLGEFSFFSFQPEGMATIEELYLESLKIVADAKEIDKLIVISFNEEYGEKVNDILNKVDGKEIIQFRMNEPEYRTSYRWEMLAYPIMQALGLKGEELQ